MLHKVNLTGIIMLIFFWSCNKTDSGPGYNISNNVMITVLNQAGEDLLDTDSPSSIDLDKTKVYYELDGVKTEINRANLDLPKMFVLEEPGEASDFHRIFLFLNSEDDSDTTTTYLELEENRTYVFKSLLKRDENGINDEKIWLDDELVCDISVTPGRCEVTITIDK